MPPPLHPQLPGGVGRLFPEAAGRLQPADQPQQPFQRAAGDGRDQPHQVAGLRERPAALPADGAGQRGARQPQHRHRGQNPRADTGGFWVSAEREDEVATEPRYYQACHTSFYS